MQMWRLPPGKFRQSFEKNILFFSFAATSEALSLYKLLPR